MKGLDDYSESLTAIFKRLQPREAHMEAKELLLEMAKDADVFMEIVRRNILSPGFFSIKRNNPVIVLSIADNPYITIVANFWLPLPDRAINISHQSVHHHGKL
ncbi:MAG: hypothetical protein H7259_09530, partial [Cytophagales bacterium]|nr:hypothetical protein [Cytophaga sp.]